MPQFTHTSAITEGGDKHANMVASFSGHLAQMNDLIRDPNLDISNWEVPTEDGVGTLKLRDRLGVDRVTTCVEVVAGADSMGCCAFLGLTGPSAKHGCNYCERESARFCFTDGLEDDVPRTLTKLKMTSHLHIGTCPDCKVL